MTRPNLLRPSILYLALLFSTVQAQGTESEVLQTVEVKEIKNPVLKSYRTLRKGVLAYEKYHALAPQAPFRLILVVSNEKFDMRALTLKVVGKDSEVPIPVAEDGSFELPQLTGSEWSNAQLILNQKSSELSVGWRPFIRTPSMPSDIRRLGDLRLECEIQWAIDQDDLSFVSRNAFKIIGGPCNSSHVQIGFEATHKLTEAILRTSDRQESIKLTGGSKSFIAPLYDKTWPDEAQIELH